MIVNKPKKKKKVSRYVALNIVMFVIFGAIISKLLYIQVYKYEDYKEKADTGSTRFIDEKAPRGKIYDSEGDILATNIQTYALTYTEGEKTEDDFYQTMESVFKILAENGEKFQDDLLLKIDGNGNFYYDFKTDNQEARRSVELRFKRDRGLNEKIEKELYEDKKTDLTDEEIERVNSDLFKLSPEDTFYELVKLYNMYELVNPDPTNEELDAYDNMSGKDMTAQILQKYSLNDIRNYMVIKDARKMQSFKGYKAVTIASNIKKDTAFIVYQKLNDLPGIDVSLESIRHYPYNNLASSALGYVSTIDSSKKESYELRGYDVSSDLVGASGIEATFEEHLKGVKGGTTVKVNSKGRITENLFKLESYPGNNVHLTIDKDIQYVAEQATKDTLERIRNEEGQQSATRAATVAIEVNTGRILALVSYPDYDPNIFSVPGRITPEETVKYFNPDLDTFGREHIRKTGASGSIDDLFPVDPQTGVRYDKFDIYPKSFYNYATKALLPPGSIFKPLTSIAGLMEGVISTSEYMNDTSGFWINEDLNMKVENFAKRANGPTDVRMALEVSSNYFYYETGYRLYMQNGANTEALDSIAKYAWKFGLGVDPKSPEAKHPTTGIEIEENFGQTYNFESWKKKIIENPMFALADIMDSGHYLGYSFIPFDFSKDENDSEILSNAKESIKQKITDTLWKVGTPEEDGNYEKFAESIRPDVKTVVENSEKYKNRVREREAAGNKVNIEDQIDVVADVISMHTISDQATAITSPAQIIYNAIGQGMLTFTPVQLANYVATLANGGTRYDIMMVDKITTPTGEVVKEFQPQALDKIDIPDEYLQAVKDGMYRVNTNPSNGWAYKSFANFPIKVGGKTGTADFGTEEQYNFQGRRPNGNYISMAPLDKPEIAVFSTVYDGDKGSSGATIHKAIYEAYFKDELLKMDPNYGDKSSSFRKYVLESPLKDNR